MTNVPSARDLAIDASSTKDPASGLRAVAAMRRLLEILEAMHVQNARRQGWAWERIADCLGVSRQAVHKKHGKGKRS
jgi:hypothetical protein